MNVPGRRSGQGRGRRGILIPLVVCVLVVMFILGYFLMQGGSSEYMQTSMVIHGLQANTLALSAFEEARLWVGRRLDPKVVDRALRQALLSAARSDPPLNYPPGDDWLDLTTELKASDGLSGLGADGWGAELKVWLKFYGFRPLWNSASGVLNDPDKNYRHAAFDTKGRCPRDFVGYYTVVANARYGQTIRTFSSTHDIKITEVTPPAPRHAFFQWGPVSEAQYRSDLNTGDGCLFVYPNYAGRVFVRGPYVVNLGSSHANGTGGNNRDQQIVFPESYGDWYRWSLLPPPRDGVSEPVFFSSKDPGRPKRTNRKFGLGLIFNLAASDPGARLVKKQQWWVAAGGKQTFSVHGAPVPGGGMAFSPPAGVVSYLGNDPPEAEAWREYCREVNEQTEADTRWPGLSEGWFISPEGQLYAGIKKASFKRWTFKILFVKFWGYKVSVENRIQAVPYGAFYEDKRDISGAFSLFDFASLVISCITLGTGDFIAAGGEFLWDQFFTALGEEALDSLMRNKMFEDIFNQGPTVADVLDPASIEDKAPNGLFPPGMKHYGRSAAKHYPDLASALGPDGILHLDGGITVEKLDHDAPLTYEGRGWLHHAVEGGADPKLAGGIHTDAPNVDHLTVVVSDVENADQGTSMLEIGGTDNRASFCVDHGLTTRNDLWVRGNYVCIYPNKRLLPATARLRVAYPVSLLAGVDPESESWMSVVASPKIAGFTDSLAIARGGAAMTEPEF